MSPKRVRKRPDPSVEADETEVVEPEIIGGEDDVAASDAADADLSEDEADSGDLLLAGADDEDEGDDGEDLESGAPSGSSSSVPALPLRSTDTSLAPQDTLGRYFSELSKYPLLTREEEFELAVQVHDHGDAEAAQKLVLSNLRLVVKIAMEYRRVWTNVMDLIQEGNVGLLQGVKRFDPHRGVKLSSYAAYWIRAYLLKYLIDNIRLVRVGSSRAERKLFFQLNRAKRALEREGLAPEPKLIAEKIGVKEPEVVDMERRLAHGDLSLDAPSRRDDPDSAAFGDHIAAENVPVDEAVNAATMRETFHEHIDRFRGNLDEREAVILDQRILSEDPATLQEVGDQFGLTRERVRQIEKRLVGRLREYLKENLVDFDYWAPDT